MCARGLSVATSNVMAMICKRARMPNEDGPGARSAALTLAGDLGAPQTHDSILFGRARLQAMNEGALAPTSNIAVPSSEPEFSGRGL